MIMEVFLIIATFFTLIDGEREILLPHPQLTGKVSLEEALKKRRTLRNYSNEPITLKELSQILWSCQGITSFEGLRTAPSAGALYPLEIFLVVGNVDKLENGMYHYDVKKHSLKKVKSGDLRRELSYSALGQEQIQNAAVNLVITAVIERTAMKYGERARRYVYIEVGHAAQNVLLQAEALGLGVCPIGAFYDEKVKKTLGLKEEEPIYILTVGKKHIN